MNETQLAVRYLNGEWPADHPQGSARYKTLVKRPAGDAGPLYACVDEVSPHYDVVCTKDEFMSEVMFGEFFNPIL